MALLIELLAMAAFGALGWLGGRSGVEHALAKAAAITADEVRTADQIHAQAVRAGLFFAAGIAALMLGRLVSARRRAPTAARSVATTRTRSSAVPTSACSR